MIFKIGDKVKITNSKSPYIGEVGRVKTVFHLTRELNIIVKLDETSTRLSGYSYPVCEWEIEKC